VFCLWLLGQTHLGPPHSKQVRASQCCQVAVFTAILLKSSGK
jgi:hypothetical protein